jgi:hypothetical protein
METTFQETDELLQTEEAPIKNSLLPRILRYLGATTLGLSALSFAIQRMGELDSMGRFYSFLGFTGVLALCGFFCALRIKEDKGARTFLGISLVFLPVLFLQLGALVYFVLHGTPPGFPAMFSLSTQTTTSVIVALAMALPIAALISIGGFAALVRNRAIELTAVFAIGIATLLVPTRVVDEVSMMLLGGGVIVASYAMRMKRIDRVFQTFEGKAALTITALPLVLLVSRTAILYSPTALLGAALSIVFGSLFWAQHSEQEDGYASRSQKIALSFFAAGWAFFCAALACDSRGIFYSSYLADIRQTILLPLITLPISAGLLAISSQLGKSERGALRIAGSIAAYPLAFQVMTVSSIPLTAAGLVIGAGLITGAFLRRDRVILTGGTILLSVVMGMNIHYAFDIYHSNPWLVLGITGGAIVLASSYIERNMALLLARLGRIQSEFGEWS